MQNGLKKMAGEEESGHQRIKTESPGLGIGGSYCPQPPSHPAPHSGVLFTCLPPHSEDPAGWIPGHQVTGPVPCLFVPRFPYQAHEPIPPRVFTDSVE